MIVKKDKLPPKNLLIKNLFEKRATKMKKLEFKTNEYITLKLENGRTNIYVKDEYFQQCEDLLPNIPVENLDKYDEIQSIDDVTEGFDKSLEYKDSKNFNISPETEFWRYCSNLQAWAENEYDTRLLHRNIAFSLLKRLTQEGDPKAKKVFKKEIIERFMSNYIPIRNFLIEMGYLVYFNPEEIKYLLEDFGEFISASTFSYFKRYYCFEWNMKALVYDTYNQSEKAIKVCEQVLSLFPDDTEAWENLGFFLTKQEEYEEAITAYNRALELEENKDGIYERLAIVNFLLKNYDKAMTYCRCVRNQNPEISSSLRTLGRSYFGKRKLLRSLIINFKRFVLNPKIYLFYSRRRIRGYIWRLLNNEL